VERILAAADGLTHFEREGEAEPRQP